jgi:hypothetical protein
MTATPYQALTWHQQQAARRRWKTRNMSAHIRAADWIWTGRTLCGRTQHAVHVDAEHRNNPANGTCARCKAAADKLELPTIPTP